MNGFELKQPTYKGNFKSKVKQTCFASFAFGSITVTILNTETKENGKKPTGQDEQTQLNCALLKEIFV